jgi:carbonic anhydrase
MKRFFQFQSPRAPYVADATVLCCFDRRFHVAIDEFLRRRQIRTPDMIVVAGGAKILASPRIEFEREFIIEQVRLSLNLHGAKRIILTNHSDCGAYGGLPAFERDTQVEAEHHAKELQKALNLVREVFPAVAVETYFVDFEGVRDLSNPT